MALLTFKGGIHPDDGKSLAKDKAIVDVKPKGDLVYPVSQHIWNCKSNRTTSESDRRKSEQYRDRK